MNLTRFLQSRIPLNFPSSVGWKISITDVQFNISVGGAKILFISVRERIGNFAYAKI